MEMTERLVAAAFSSLENLPQALGRSLSNGRARELVNAVQVDSPLITAFVALCVFVHLLPGDGGGAPAFFSCPPWRAFDVRSPLAYLRLLSHAVGHGSVAHLRGNVVNLLLVGPACERAFGAVHLLKIMLWTAFASGVAHMALGKAGTAQLGASGVVFSLILLNSLLARKGGKLSLTFVLTAALWLSGELGGALSGGNSGISHVAHLSGALVGTVFGYRRLKLSVRERLAHARAAFSGYKGE